MEIIEAFLSHHLKTQHASRRLTNFKEPTYVLTRYVTILPTETDSRPMERGYGDESATVNDRLIPRRPVTSQFRDENYPEPLQRGPQAYQPNAMESADLRPVSLSWQPPETGNSSESTLRPHAYQQYAPIPVGKSELRYSLQGDPSAVKGYVIQPNWKRHFLTWILAFLAICFFVFTVIFAWNATGGSNADPKYLFNDPGHTILVLQVCSTATTALFAELIVASCEMVHHEILLY